MNKQFSFYKVAIMILSLSLLLTCGCVSQRGQIMDGDGMFNIDPDEDSAPEDDLKEYLATFKTVGEYYDFLTARSKEKFVADGIISESDPVFIAPEIYRLEEDYFYTNHDEGADLSEAYTFFCFDESGRIVPLKCDAAFDILDGFIRVSSVEYTTVAQAMEEAGEQLTEEAGEQAPEDDYYRLFEGFDFSYFSTSFEELFKYQTEADAKALEKIMTDNGLSPDKLLASVFFVQDEDSYRDPAKAVDVLIPELKDCPKRVFFSSEWNCWVFVDLGRDKEAFVGTEALGRSGDGDYLYALSYGGWITKDWEDRIAKLYSATAADLEASKEISFTDVYMELEGPKYFYAGNFEGTDAELYGMYDCAGYLFRLGDDVYPINTFVGRDGPLNMTAGDFDDDGSLEYGFVNLDGWGTGYYTNCLIIVDPGEERPVSFFDQDDLMLYYGNLYSRVKSEVDEQAGTLKFWLETDGTVSDEGEITLAKKITDDFKCSGLGFGDWFTIDHDTGDWVFTASGGTLWTGFAEPDYESSVSLRGKIVYKNGNITYTDISLGAE